MSQLISNADVLLTGQGSSSYQSIEKVSGMDPMSPHSWQWHLDGGGHQDGRAAAVKVLPGDTIQVLLDVADPPPQRAALTASHGLPGNLRFARRAGRTALLADTQLDGAAHLPLSFAALKRGLQLALDGRAQKLPSPPLSTDEIEDALAKCHWPEDHIVELEGAWEFRPRLRGDAKPVLVAIDGDQLRFSRAVVADWDSAAGAEGVAEQALRFNHQIRHARLAVADGHLVAETQLHREQLSPTWLDIASRAVASASRYAEGVLAVLAGDPELAHHYAAMFMSLGDEPLDDQRNSSRMTS